MQRGWWHMAEHESRVGHTAETAVSLALFVAIANETLSLVSSLDVVRQHWPDMERVAAWMLPEHWSIALLLATAIIWLAIKLVRGHEHIVRWTALCGVLVVWGLANLFASSRAHYHAHDRRIPKSVKESIASNLAAQCNPKANCTPPDVSVSWEPSQEAATYAKDLVEIFRRAKWPVRQARNDTQMYRATWFVFDEDGQWAELAGKVYRELNEAFTDVCHNPESKPAGREEWSFWVGPRDPLRDEARTQKAR